MLVARPKNKRIIKILAKVLHSFFPLISSFYFATTLCVIVEPVACLTDAGCKAGFGSFILARNLWLAEAIFLSVFLILLSAYLIFLQLCTNTFSPNYSHDQGTSKICVSIFLKLLLVFGLFFKRSTGTVQFLYFLFLVCLGANFYANVSRRLPLSSGLLAFKSLTATLPLVVAFYAWLALVLGSLPTDTFSILNFVAMNVILVYLGIHWQSRDRGIVLQDYSDMKISPTIERHIRDIVEVIENGYFEERLSLVLQMEANRIKNISQNHIKGSVEVQVALLMAKSNKFSSILEIQQLGKFNKKSVVL